MPELFIFLLKVNVSLILFCLAYYLILRRLTFYTLNRFFLIGGIIFSSLYPFVDLSVFFKEPAHLVLPLYTALPAVYAATQVSPVDYWFYSRCIFWAGVLVMSVKMVISLAALRKIHIQSSPSVRNGYPVRLLQGSLSTFSFWKSIYLNPGQHDEEELKAVLEHEQVHVKELHTFDILLAEMAVIFYWFNPGIWYMRKAVKENVEFITDQKILKQGADRKAYQYSMLQSSVGIRPSVLMNNFNLTGVKRRIVMMNSRKSSSFQLIRYVCLLPVIVLFCMAFSFVRSTSTPLKKGLQKAVIQEKQTVLQKAKKKSVIVHKISTDTAASKPAIDKFLFTFKTRDHKVPNPAEDEPKDSTAIPAGKFRKVIVVRVISDTLTSTSKDANVILNGAPGSAMIIQKKNISSKIYINGKEISAEDLSKVDPADIVNIKIHGNNSDSTKKSIYILKRVPKN